MAEIVWHIDIFDAIGCGLGVIGLAIFLAVWAWKYSTSRRKAPPSSQGPGNPPRNSLK